MRISDKKTIIYYGSFNLPDKNAAAHRVVSVGKILRELGYNVIFLSGNPELYESKKVFPVSNSYDFEMYEESYPKTTFQWLKWLFSIDNLKKIVSDNNDVVAVFLYNSPYSILKLVSSFCKNQNIKVVYDYPEWCSVTYGSVVKRLFKQLDTLLVRKFVCSNVDALIVISRFMEDYYKNKNLPMIRLTPMVDINDSIWYQIPDRIPDKISVIFAGTIDASKDFLDRIVVAFGLLDISDAVLRIVGVSYGDFKTAFPGVSVDTDRVFFYGRKTHADTIKYVLGSDAYIFIRPSDIRNNAGFPTKFTEAVTTGIPIITTDVSDVNAYFGKGVVGEVLNSVEIRDIEMALSSIIDKVKNGFFPRSGICSVFDYRNYTCDVEKWIKFLE